MENAMMIGLARQLTLRTAMDVTANNLANLSTAGFKLEIPALVVAEERDLAGGDGPSDVSFVETWALLRDFSAGPLEATGRPLDLALEGEGFFAIERDGETLYTRDGRFALDADGRLVTATGAAVLDEGGGEIVLPLDAGAPTISPAGDVLVDGAAVARLQVSRFETLAALEKRPDAAFSAAGAEPQPVDDPRVVQGFVEGSNVQPIVEITRMIEIQRAYESVTRMIQADEELKRKAIDRLGRAS